MPFTDRHGNPLRSLPLIYRLGRDFQVAEPFCWQDPRKGAPVLEIPAHNIELPPSDGNGTDFASVPPFLWGLIASYGKQTLPAILHDFLANQARLAPTKERLDLRRTADETFRVALIDSGVHQLRARVMWAAVGMERYARYAGAFGAAIIAQLSVGVVAIIAAVVLAVLVHPLWLLLSIIPAIAALLWGKNMDLVVASSYLGALYAPLVAAAFVASRAEQFVAFVVWLATGTPGAVPRAEPTLRWPERTKAAPHTAERPLP